MKCLIFLCLCITGSAWAQNIGIGTVSPDASAKLEIASDTSGILIPRMTSEQRNAIADPATGLMVFVTTDSTFYYFSGHAWHGLDSLARQLSDRDGDTRVEVEQTPDEDNIRFSIGGTEYFRMDSGRLEVLNSGQSVIIGEGAGMNGPGAGTVYIGHQSGQTATSGLFNTGVGMLALQNIVDASWNTAVGFGALKDNNALGNTAVGIQSLYVNTSGEFNVGMGYRTLESNTTGGSNTAIGMKALLNNTMAREVVAIGDSALLMSGMGAPAGLRQGNTGVGSNALSSVILGQHNTSLGYEAGRYATGSGNTFIGYQAGLNEAGDDRLYIDNSSTPSPLVYGDSAADSLSINGKLNVEEAIRIGSSGSDAPEAGTIRWKASTEDFEGYNGQAWVSLTSKFSFGTSVAHLAIPDYSAEANDGGYSDWFGFSVGIDSSYAVVGAPYHGDPGDGKAYIYHRVGPIWDQQDVLVPDDAMTFDDIGYSVAISGEYAIVGAPGHDVGGMQNQGKVYIFKRSGSTWAQEDTLTASDGNVNDRFGQAVAISGDYAIVGAQNAQAYVFYRTGTDWNEQDILLPSDPQLGDKFAGSVSISGDYAIVGAQGKTNGGNLNQGKVYIFHRTGTDWNQQYSMIASDGSPSDGVVGDAFGHSVSISGDYAIVGAHLHNSGGNLDRGQAYIFHRMGASWIEEDILAMPDGVDEDHFGYSVSISGDLAIASARNHNAFGQKYKGKAYIFQRVGSDWTGQPVTSFDGGAGDRFGDGVAITDEGFAIVGAPLFDDLTGYPAPFYDEGKVYFFSKKY